MNAKGSRLLRDANGALAAFVAVALAACGESAPVRSTNPDDVIARMPALLRDRVDSAAGRHELESALEDADRLKQEARARKIQERPEVRRQVEEFEDRVIVQVLLKEEIQTDVTDEATQSRFWEEHQSLFRQPERVRVGRVFVATRDDETAARKRAVDLRERLKKGEPLASVAKDGDGPERVHGGDLGFIKSDHPDRALAKAAFALGKEPSDVIPTDGGFSVLIALERTPAHVVPFEEARAEVAAQMRPQLERRALKNLLDRLPEVSR